MNKKVIPWLQDFAASWQRQVAGDRAPHAVMLLGAPGVGKRCAAAWLAMQKLFPDSAAATPEYPLSLRDHPDLHWLSKPEDKQSIVIDQVRALIAELSLTSHAGTGKVAIIEPANIMTNQAANGLLKTLEEPPGDALLILIVDRMARLPATILSRCQRISLALPDESTGIAWLEELQPGARWAQALAEAGGAPVAAVAALERIEDADVMAKELAALAARQASPIDIAERWFKQHPEVALDWLGRQVQICIRRQQDATARKAVVDDSVLQRIDSRNLFCYLDIINRLRGQAGGSYNLQLTLEALLIDWAEGLANCHARGQVGSLWSLAGAR